MSASASTRIARASVALWTAWCLGSAGFVPLIIAQADAVARHGPACDGMAMDDSSELATEPGVSAPHKDASMDCGCAQTCAATIVDADGVTPNLRAPSVAVVDVIAPLSAARRPLLPPPEHVSA